MTEEIEHLHTPAVAAAFYADQPGGRFFWWTPLRPVNEQIVHTYAVEHGPGTTITLPPEVAAALDTFLLGGSGDVLSTHFATLYAVGGGEGVPVPDGETALLVQATAFVLPPWFLQRVQRVMKLRQALKALASGAGTSTTWTTPGRTPISPGVSRGRRRAYPRSCHSSPSSPPRR